MVNFNEYPYRNLTDLNLDYLEKKMNVLKEIMDTFVTLNTVTFADPIIWNIATQYARNTIVLDSAGNAYLSKMAVPAGVQLNNSDFWLEIFNFTEYTRTANQNLTINVESNTTRATHAYNVDDWLIWNDILYKVTSAIAVDDTLMVGTNIVHFTVEDFIKAFMTWATNTINQYKNEIDASELAYKNDIDASELAYQTAMQAQVDRILAGATVDSEVIDARLGADGVNYATLGLAIRTQFTHAIENHQKLLASLDGNYDNNILFGYDIHQGGYYDNGTMTPDVNWGYTDLIPVSASTSYTATAEVGGSFVTYWDSNNNYINRKTLTPPNTLTFTTPSNCANIRFSQHKNFYTAGGKIYETAKPYKAYGKRAYDKLNYPNYNPTFHSFIELYGSFGSSFLADLNDALDNATYIIQRTNQLTTANFPADFPNNGAVAVLHSYGETHYSGSQWQKLQLLTILKTNQTWYRVCTSIDGWDDWYRTDQHIIEIGPDKPYTTLRSGIEAAYKIPNAKVFVYPGTYDLTSEFSDVINSSMSSTGLTLGNGMHVFFYEKALVRANFDNSGGIYDAATWDAIYEHFEPFRVGEGDFILEGVDIEATDTRYCVHDEKYSQGTYKHVFKDCKMKYTNTHNPVKYVTCIGGGLGVHGTIEIIGGHYESVPNGCYSYITNNDPTYCQQCISYHNASGDSGSKITIKDVYLANNGYFRFGWYGSGANITPIYISNCREGLATLVKREASTYNTINMALYEWNNDVNVASHWILSNNNLNATLALD